MTFKVLPIEDGEIIVSLTKGRPSAKSLWTSPTLQDWLLATNIRLRLIQTKTMLGHLMSVAQGDKTVTRRVRYFHFYIMKHYFMSKIEILRTLTKGQLSNLRINL